MRQAIDTIFNLIQSRGEIPGLVMACVRQETDLGEVAIVETAPDRFGLTIVSGAAMTLADPAALADRLDVELRGGAIIEFDLDLDKVKERLEIIYAYEEELRCLRQQARVYRFRAEIRHPESQRYNADWRSCEQSVDLGCDATVELTPEVREGDEYDDGVVSHALVTFHGPVEDKDAVAAISRHFEASCSCEHDCCGHQNGGAWPIVKVGEGKWLAEVAYRPNY